MLLEVRCVMKKWSTTHLQHIGCLAATCQRSPTTLDVAAKKSPGGYVVYEHQASSTEKNWRLTPHNATSVGSTKSKNNQQPVGNLMSNTRYLLATDQLGRQ
jgi:hypothetical protein